MVYAINLDNSHIKKMEIIYVHSLNIIHIHSLSMFIH